ncbi:MAG: protein kinase domain-containing protein [Candidatus Eutrophobiaceae bacterium]
MNQINIPKKLGKYEVKDEIDRGSMGVVYLGYDPYENVEVALKVALNDPAADPISEERNRKLFFNEAHAAGMLEHPNVTKVVDAGSEDGFCYIVMEYIKGGLTLRKYIDPQNLLPINEVVEIVFKCAKALDYAHSLGVIHRDIKPSNILVTEDMDVKISDFSIAQMKHNEDGDERTHLMGMVGSPRYMSPEQIREEMPTHQTDIYSLGVVMYELLTGKQPFQGNSFSSLMNKILSKEPEPPIHLCPDISQSLNDIVMTCLSKELETRYQNGDSLALDLGRSFGHLAKSERIISEHERCNRVKGLSFFRGFPENEILEIVRSSMWLNFKLGEKIIQEGDLDESFYIIVSGKVEVRKGNQSIRVLDQGDCFGEMGFLSRAKRSATIESVGDTIILKAISTVISRMSYSCQVRFLKVFLRILIARLSVTTENMKQPKQEEGGDDAPQDKKDNGKPDLNFTDDGNFDLELE